MRSVRFLQDRVVDDWRRGTSDEERYEAGQVYDLPPTSAERWVNRGVAEYVGRAETAPVEQAVPAPAEVKPVAPATPGQTNRQGQPRARPTA